MKDGVYMLWFKDDLKKLNKNTEDLWFDVYNNGLLEDRGYDISKMTNNEIHLAQLEIKKNYLDYLKSLPESNSFKFYCIIKEEDIIVAMARIIKKDNYHYVEGLETHRNFRQKGYGKKCLSEVLTNCKSNDISKVYSKVRKYKLASLNTHISCGFQVLKEETDDFILFNEL